VHVKPYQQLSSLYRNRDIYLSARELPEYSPGMIEIDKSINRLKAYPENGEAFIPDADIDWERISEDNLEFQWSCANK
jgi:hypothetical protein